MVLRKSASYHSEYIVNEFSKSCLLTDNFSFHHRNKFYKYRTYTFILKFAIIILLQCLINHTNIYPSDWSCNWKGFSICRSGINFLLTHFISFYITCCIFSCYCNLLTADYTITFKIVKMDKIKSFCTLIS